ncbi:uncharacterized protein LOC143764333 [Ranitomeya variabilis]|uniref:uncharacterized protein LOC143764333 n=1 Tax=Ranitomeya variabilis TaxID=490064 RepID=UPI00405659AB
MFIRTPHNIDHFNPPRFINTVFLKTTPNHATFWRHPSSVVPMIVPVIMALYTGYLSNLIEDIWREEFSPGFQEIFLSSSDLPQDGRIYVMYHGTTYSAAKDIIICGFQQSEYGMLGPGVYVSRDINKALRYPLYDKSDQVVLKLRVSVGRVKKINYKGHPLQITWHEHGYDTAWVPPYCGMVDSGLEEDCVWDPRRIKVVGIAKALPQHIQELNYLLVIEQSLVGDESYKSRESNELYKSDETGINDEFYQSDESDEIYIGDIFTRYKSGENGKSEESYKSCNRDESYESDESDGCCACVLS